MVSWQNSKLTKWWDGRKQLYKKAMQLSEKLKNLKFLKMVSWQNDNLTNEKLTKWQTVSIKSWQDGSLIKCQFDKMAHWLNKN